MYISGSEIYNLKALIVNPLHGKKIPIKGSFDGNKVFLKET